ncbi:hypothetical protein RND81_10G193800 [Saponaria officinalis]|uniref:No apical meristem-associated C-terminal domain-containing protein n=1 Tax=Saponaria officinalis TaxID=3572 RepID=A0AAW1I5C4_SAPOF
MIVSEDGTVGTNQNKSVFWQRVFELYDLARDTNPTLRPHHAWDMLKEHPKWKVFLASFATNACRVGLVGGSFTSGENEDSTSSGKRVRLEDGEYSTPISIDGESVSTQRPEGLKAAKINKGKKKVNNVEFDEMNTRFAMLNEATERDLALAREKFEFKKKNAEVALRQLAYNNKREERKRKDQEIEQRKIDWQMLQQLLQASSLPPQLEKMKHDLLNKFGGH